MDPLAYFVIALLGAVLAYIIASREQLRKHQVDYIDRLEKRIDSLEVANEKCIEDGAGMRAEIIILKANVVAQSVKTAATEAAQKVKDTANKP